MKKYVLYGAGFGGEKFYCVYRKKYNTEFVLDRNNGRFFHGIPVYSFEDYL